MNAPVLVLNTNTKRENGRKAQLANIMAGKTVADLMAKDKLTGADDKIAFSVYHDATNNKIKAIVVTAY